MLKAGEEAVRDDGSAQTSGSAQIEAHQAEGSVQSGGVEEAAGSAGLGGSPEVAAPQQPGVAETAQPMGQEAPATGGTAWERSGEC